MITCTIKKKRAVDAGDRKEKQMQVHIELKELVNGLKRNQQLRVVIIDYGSSTLLFDDLSVPCFSPLDVTRSEETQHLSLFSELFTVD